MKKIALVVCALVGILWCSFVFGATSAPIYGLSKNLDMWVYTTTTNETYELTDAEFPMFIGKLVYSVEVSGGDAAYTVTITDPVSGVVFTSTTCNSSAGTIEVGINQPIWGKLSVVTSAVSSGTVTVRIGLWK